MLEIKNSNIRMTRGDDVEFELQLFDPNDNVVELSDIQFARFSVRRGPKHDNSTPPLIQKTFDANGVVELQSIDTKFLKYGVYLWDCEVVDGAGRISTVCLGHFILEYEIG